MDETTDNTSHIITELATLQNRLTTIKSRILSVVDKMTAFNNQLIGASEPSDHPSDAVRASEETSLGLMVGKIDDIEDQLTNLESQVSRL